MRDNALISCKTTRHGQLAGYWQTLLGLALLASSVAAENLPDTLRLARFQGSGDTGLAYLQQLLQAALLHTRDFRHLPVELTEQTMSPPRMFGEISKPGGLSNILVWACDSSFMQARDVRRIDIPVDRGMLSYWLIITRNELLPAYRQATSLAQLRAMKLTFGYPLGEHLRPHWRQNLDIHDAPDMKQALLMLEHGRFDGIIVSAIHAQALRASLPADGKLVLEPHLLLVYPSAACFATGQHQAKLAQQLQQGLATIINNGSAEKISRANHQSSLAPELGIRQRQRLMLQTDPKLAPMLKQYQQWLYKP